MYRAPAVPASGAAAEANNETIYIYIYIYLLYLYLYTVHLYNVTAPRRASSRARKGTV